MFLSEFSDSLLSAFYQTSFTECLIFITALLYIVLAAIENVWCWLFGIISSTLLVYLCFTGHLFLESGLNIFYVVIGIYGWYQWLYGSDQKTELPITTFPIQKNLLLIGIGIVIWLPFGFFAHRYSTQVLPYLDAFITSFSIIATWLQAKKIIENWLYFILLNGLSILLYAYRDFYLLAILSFIYTLLSVTGYLSWRKRITT